MDYKTAYNKIIDAYFKDEMQPMDSTFCFCGNLCDKDSSWNTVQNRIESDRKFPYTYKEFYLMEDGLFSGMEGYNF